MSRPAHAAALALLALVLTGCGAAPRASVRPSPVVDTSPGAVVLAFDVAIENPGRVELPLRTVRYALRVDGRRVFEGARSAEATLPREGAQTVELPVPVRWEDLPQGQAEYELRGSIGYRRPAVFLRALADAGLYRPRVRFTHNGTLDTADLPRPASQGGAGGEAAREDDGPGPPGG